MGAAYRPSISGQTLTVPTGGTGTVSTGDDQGVCWISYTISSAGAPTFSAQPQVRLLDGTWVNHGTAITALGGAAVANLAVKGFRLVIGAATGVADLTMEVRALTA
jgi:hypothetical protein